MSRVHQTLRREKEPPRPPGRRPPAGGAPPDNRDDAQRLADVQAQVQDLQQALAAEQQVSRELRERLALAEAARANAEQALGEQASQQGHRIAELCEQIRGLNELIDSAAIPRAPRGGGAPPESGGSLLSQARSRKP